MIEPSSLTRLDARTIVGLTIYGESRGEPVEGKIGVGNVIRNRVRAQYRGQSYHEVCLAPKQFSCWNLRDPNRARLLRLADLLVAGPITGNPVLTECLFLALGIVTEAIRDNTQQATHYHERSVHPAWAEGRAPVVILGHHLFFADVP